MKLLKPSLFSASVVLFCTALSAETFNWNGSADTFFWSDAGNWAQNAEPDSETADVRLEVPNSLSGDYGLRLDENRLVRSLYFNLARNALIASNTRTLQLAHMGSITLGSKFSGTGANTSAVVFTSTSASQRLRLSALGDLTLRNDGTGNASFNAAHLFNDSAATTDSTFTFEGAGNWRFMPNSYVGRQTTDNGGANAPHGVSLALADNFTGTLVYDALLTAGLKSLRVNNGTLVVNTQMQLADGGQINLGGTLSGTGTLIGDLQVSGKLMPSAPGGTSTVLTIDGNLSLTADSHLSLRILSTGQADQIIVTGALSAAGILNIDNQYPGVEFSNVLLYDGFTAITGNFSAVILNAEGLEYQGDGLWSGNINGYTYNFDTMTGMLSASAIPEPSAIAGLLALICAGGAALRRRQSR